jgi:hypothetical protein
MGIQHSDIQAANGLVSKSGLDGNRLLVPPFRSRAFYEACSDVQEAVMQHPWPQHSVMVTVTLVGKEVRDVDGFNAFMLGGQAARHSRIIFHQLQEQANGSRQYKSRRKVSPAIVVPERLTRKPENGHSAIIPVHYHAAIGFHDYWDAITFKLEKKKALQRKLSRYLRNGQAEEGGFDGMKIKMQVMREGTGYKAFRYSCKYLHDLLEHAAYCTPAQSVGFYI